MKRQKLTRAIALLLTGLGAAGLLSNQAWTQVEELKQCKDKPYQCSGPSGQCCGYHGCQVDGNGCHAW